MGWLTLYVFLVQHTEQTPRLVMSIIATSLAFTVFNLLQLHRNDVEDQMRISGSRHHLAPGLALLSSRGSAACLARGCRASGAVRPMTGREGLRHHALDRNPQLAPLPM